MSPKCDSQISRAGSTGFGFESPHSGQPIQFDQNQLHALLKEKEIGSEDGKLVIVMSVVCHLHSMDLGPETQCMGATCID